MGKHHPGYRGVETCGDRTGNTATDEDICCQEPSGDLAKRASHRRAEMDQRSILSDRCTASRRNKGRKG